MSSPVQDQATTPIKPSAVGVETGSIYIDTAGIIWRSNGATWDQLIFGKAPGNIDAGLNVLTDGATITVDTSLGGHHTVTIAASRIMAFTNVKAGRKFTVAVKQGGVGWFLITWPAAVKWPSGVAPVLTNTPAKTDIFAFTDDGTNWFGSTVSLNS